MLEITESDFSQEKLKGRNAEMRGITNAAIKHTKHYSSML